MKTKFNLSIVFILLIIIYCPGCEDPPPETPTYDEAIQIIKSFKNDIVSPEQVLLSSSQSVELGEAWIYDNCMETVCHRWATLYGQFSGNNYSKTTENQTEKEINFYWENNWVSNHSIEADIKYELLEAVLKAAYKNSEIHSLDFKLSLKDPVCVKLSNPGPFVTEYKDYLIKEGITTEGNIIISAIVKGKLHVEFKAYNEDKQEISFDLSTELNEFISENLSFDPGYKYFNEKNQSGGYSIIEESGENLTAFAIEYTEIASEVQNQTEISNKIIEFCQSGGSNISCKYVEGKCLNSGNNIVDLEVEKGAVDRKLFLSWTNVSDTPLTSFSYTLNVRNKFGQKLKSWSRRVNDNINPGVTLEKGEIPTYVDAEIYFELEDVEFELVITEARNGAEIICE